MVERVVISCGICLLEQLFVIITTMFCICHSSLMHAVSGAVRDENLRSERVKCGLLPDTQGTPYHNRPADLYGASPDAWEGAGAYWLAAVIGVVSTRERSLLLLVSARVAFMDDDEPWERSFQFCPFAVDIFGVYGVDATAILQQLARNRGEHTSTSVGACRWLAFQCRTADCERAVVCDEETVSLACSPLP
jgi:hypothetical protein